MVCNEQPDSVSGSNYLRITATKRKDLEMKLPVENAPKIAVILQL
jgi:hypothetical protein